MKIKSMQSIHLFLSVIKTIYDIVKAHGDELKVETNEGEVSGFLIHLPYHVNS